MKINKEQEGHYYICLIGGCFYKIENGNQKMLNMNELKYTNESNFHISIYPHKCKKDEIKLQNSKKLQKNDNIQHKNQKNLLHKVKKDNTIKYNDSKKSFPPIDFKSKFI